MEFDNFQIKDMLFVDKPEIRDLVFIFKPEIINTVGIDCVDKIGWFPVHWF